MKTIIINYHFIKDSLNPKWNGLKGISAQTFEAQIKILKKYFNVISLTDYAKLIKNNNNNGNYCIITFDDGSLDCYERAFPILSKLHVPASYFICSDSSFGDKVLTIHKINILIDILGPGKLLNKIRKMLSPLTHDIPPNINTNKLYPYDSGAKRSLKILLNYQLPKNIKIECIRKIFNETDLNEEDVTNHLYIKPRHIKIMMQEGFDFGMHSSHHEVLSGYTDSELKTDLESNFKHIRSIVKPYAPIDMAYPFGMKESYDERAKSILKNLGVRFAVSMLRQPNFDCPADPYELKRFDCMDLFTRDGTPTHVFKELI